MNSNFRDRTPAGGLALEPLEEEVAKSVDAPAKGPAKFTANTRGGGDRRKGDERREEIRFQEDRRTAKDRRPRKTWERGKNL
jgi:hypothetical protein